jgi:hypothetical protein
MEKEYIIPKTETVHLDIKDSVMDEITIPIGSGTTSRQGAKSNNGFFDDTDYDDENQEDASDNSWGNPSVDLWK